MELKITRKMLWLPATNMLKIMHIPCALHNSLCFTPIETYSSVRNINLIRIHIQTPLCCIIYFQHNLLLLTAAVHNLWGLHTFSVYICYVQGPNQG